MSSLVPAWQEIRATLAPRRDGEDGALPPLLLLVTVVTGLVDALAYLGLRHVFVGNMTGNVVFLGFAAAGAHGLSVPGSLIALACFIPGAAVAGRLLARLAEGRHARLGTATAVQALLFASALPITVAAGPHPGSGSRYAVIGLLSIAMGIQGATARMLGLPEFTTIVLTQTLTSIAAGSEGKVARRTLSVLAMLLGALIGALLLLHVDPYAPLAVATSLLVVVAAAAGRAARAGPG